MAERVVVLGGAGFLGSHLCERLLAGGDEVVCLDNLCTGDRGNIAHLERDPRFRFVRADVTEPLAVDGPVHRVANLASPASPIDYARLWLETLRAGSLGTERGLQLAEAKGAVFLQASTSEIYGDPTVHPQTESYLGNVDSTGPRAVYDEAKRYGEAIVYGYHRARGVDVRVVRIFNTYGPRMRLKDGRVVPAFIGQALRGEALTVFGDGTQTRSFCFVDDEIEGLVRLLHSSETRPVNIGNPTEFTMLELAKAVTDVCGTPLRLEHRPLPQGDPKQRRPDIGRAREVLGWEPNVALVEGIRRTVEWFRGRVAPRRGGD